MLLTKGFTHLFIFSVLANLGFPLLSIFFIRKKLTSPQSRSQNFVVLKKMPFDVKSKKKAN
jgi:hypothetical protein